jgi:soluble lytic murein transglycosylase
MNLTRSLSPRRLLMCTLAATVAFGVFGAPAFAAKPAEKPAKSGAKPATKTTAKPAAKGKSAAPMKKDAKGKATAKPAARATAAKPGVPLPRPRPQFGVASAASAPALAPAKSLSPTAILPTFSFSPVTPASAAPAQLVEDAAPVAAPPRARVASLPAPSLQIADSNTTPAADVSLVKQAIDAIRKGRVTEASATQKSISDPVARKLVEWALLRSDDSNAGFERLSSFLSSNPSWPNATMLRRRAESALWDERRNDATVRQFFATSKPVTAKGKFALARALLAQGDRAQATALVREAWREDNCSREVERMVMDAFGDILTRADHKARMDRRLYDEDSDAGMRMAQMLGGADLAIAKARVAVIDQSSKAKALLDAVPESARHDVGYIFSRAQHLRRGDNNTDAAKLMLTASRNTSPHHDFDEWWVERRVLARKLLDEGELQLAYRVARDAVSPPRELYRGEHEFTAGWIALRFLKDPRAAYQHFARVGHGTTHPTTIARGEYWQGRAAEAMGRTSEARAHYQAAAQYPTAYYGQIARAKLGLGELNLRRPPDAGHRAALMNLEVVRATQLLYAIDARDLVIPFVADLADRAVDPGALVAMAEVAKKNDDARAMLLIGKGALARGVPMDAYAFPTIGIPPFRIVGPPVDKSVVYSIARQESAFNPQAISRAKALGLMQVLPGTGKLIARKFNFPFDQKRMLSDPAYNAQMGAAELGDVLETYRGSYILSFVAYNAGRGRVKQWIEKYGDPRDPAVDPIDWVERIPFSETRNYVQRILENMQVYRIQLGHTSRPTIEADLRRGTPAN